MAWRPRLKVRLTRDLVLFMAGLGGVMYETLARQADRPTLLILFGAMMGLPVFLASDSSKVAPTPPPAAAPPTTPPT